MISSDMCVRMARQSKNYLYILLRSINTASESKSIQTPNSKKISSDMIGPPDPVSNLRRVIFKEPPNETVLEKKYREMRQDVQNWNHDFWTQHNTRFFKEREDYLKENLPEGKQNLTADEMSVFYKSFLDKNWKTHISYNKEWYKKNFALLILALQIKIRNIFRLKN